MECCSDVQLECNTMLHRIVRLIEWLECGVVCGAMGVSYYAASFSSFYRVVGV